ncbi:MAG: capsular biosynthesis protein [Cyclobacteriaceae bacterium]|nr:capsular biosynthesis protein [Cyclobacteriaceae bacterium]
MFSWLSGTKKASLTPLAADIHSHLLPGLDDGVQSFDEAELIIRAFQSMGYRKLITTPHIISDSYRNTPEVILSKLAELKIYLAEKSIPVEIEAAAEYYLDENLVYQLENNEPLLTFGNRYLLFEVNFMVEPLNLNEFIFKLTTRGYKPVLAHPERYVFLQQQPEKIEDLINRGVLFQLNINSLTGYYSKPAQLAARKLIENKWVHFAGTDCHNANQLHLIKQAQETALYQKILSLPLLNHSLI